MSGTLPDAMRTRNLDGLLPSDFQRLFGVSRRTALRWFQVGARPQFAALARLLATGDLGALAPEWRGWVLRGGQLFDPLSSSKRGFTPGEVRAVPLMHGQIAALRAAVRRFDQEADGPPGLVRGERRAQEPLRGVLRGVRPVAAPAPEPRSNRSTERKPVP